MSVTHSVKLTALFLMFVWSALAGEYAVLANGARLYAERHESVGAKLTLYSKTGSTEMDAALVARFEPDDTVAETAQPSVPAAPVQPVSLKQMIDNAARKYGLPPAFVHAVIAAESGYHADAISPKGAIGLMQLMPATARELGVDPKVAEQNVDAGTRYLRDLLLKYDSHAYHALAAYNAGPGAVDKYHGVPPYRETQSYILNVLRHWKQTGD
jgi:soluble lytic murein transglycosylase-like protein